MLDRLSILAANYLWYAVIAIAVIHLLTLPRREQIRSLKFAAIALPLIYFVSVIAGALYYDLRPFVVGNFIPLIPHKATNGFPSDHVLWSAAIAALILPSNRYIGLILWLLTLLVGASRVYVGVHHPIDVAGSILIAVVVAVLVHLVLRRINLFGFWRNLKTTQSRAEARDL